MGRRSCGDEPRQVKRRGGVAALLHELRRDLQVALRAVGPDQAEVIPRGLVPVQSLLVVPRALAVSSPPPGELAGPGADDVALQGVRHAPPVEHARHVDVGASALFVRSNRSGHVSDAFQMPSVGVVRGFQVDAILLGCGPYGVVPPTHRLVQPVEQVVSMALLVQRYSVVDQPEVHRDIPDSRVELRL